MSSSSSDESASWSVMKTDGTMLRARYAVHQRICCSDEKLCHKKMVVIALLKYSSGVFEGTFFLCVWWVHLRRREGSNALILPPSDTIES